MIRGRGGEEGKKEKEIVMISPLGSVHQTSHHRLTGTASGRAFMGVVDTQDSLINDKHPTVI